MIGRAELSAADRPAGRLIEPIQYRCRRWGLAVAAIAVIFVSACTLSDPGLSIDVTNRCATDIDVDFFGPAEGPTGWATIKTGGRGGAGVESPHRIELEVIVRRTGTDEPVLTRRLTKEDLAALVVEEGDGDEYMDFVVEGALCP